MSTTNQANAYVEKWFAAWNAHDLEQILALWSDDCEFTSPLVTELMGEPSGTLRGKPALREYWGRALAKWPRIHLEREHLFVGLDSIVIGFRNHRGISAAEWLRLGSDGRAVQGAAHHASEGREHQ